MRFSFYKDNQIDVHKLSKVWNDNYFIFETVDIYKRFNTEITIPKHELVIWRNNKFYYLNLPTDIAQFIIWKHNLVSTIDSSPSMFRRRWFLKSAYHKVCFGYKTSSNVKYEHHYPCLNKKAPTNSHQ